MKNSFLEKPAIDLDSVWLAGDLDRRELQWMLALALSPGIGPASFQKLFDAFGSAEAIFAASSTELKSACPQLKEAALQSLLAGPNWRNVRHQEEACLRSGVKIVSVRSEFYPSPLLTLTYPLPFIFMKGTWLERDQKSLAIVGTRTPSGYGGRMTRDLSIDLVEAGFTIVSGLARGIDTIAHENTLAAGGRTVAVLGSGLDWIYPSENAPLAKRIAKQGCMISEFPMGMAPHATHFPRRNRLISALSLGTVVMEAGNDSGALITADFALDQGREIFAFPGSVENPGAKGPHRLIQSGAHLVQHAGDILQVLQGQNQARPGRRLEFSNEGEPSREKKKIQKNDKENVEVIRAGQRLDQGRELGLRSEFQDILDILGNEILSLDGLAEKTQGRDGLKNIPAHRLLTGLLELEMQGKVKHLSGSRFSRV